MFVQPIFPAPSFAPVDSRAREQAEWELRMALEMAAMRDAQRPQPQPESIPCAS